jgi:hypothetical protein
LVVEEEDEEETEDMRGNSAYVVDIEQVRYERHWNEFR